MFMCRPNLERDANGERASKVGETKGAVCVNEGVQLVWLILAVKTRQDVSLDSCNWFWEWEQVTCAIMN